MSSNSAGGDQRGPDSELATVRDRLSATQEILQIINQNRDDQQPVFEAILKNAAQLYSSPIATLMSLNDIRDFFFVAAHVGDRKIPIKANATWSLQAPLPIAQSLREARTVHVADMKKSAPYASDDPTYRRLVDGDGMQTRLSVPLLKKRHQFWLDCSD